MKFKKYILFLLFIISINSVNAQFIGGTSGTGTGIKSILSATTCVLNYDTSLLFYRGGNYGSNIAATTISNSVCPIRYDTILNIYHSGNYGGYGSTLINVSTCTTNFDTVLNIYHGGNYGSYSNVNINNTFCAFSLDSSVLIYKGGNYGTYANTSLSVTACPIPDVMNIWMGGISSNSAPGSLISMSSNNTTGPFISSIADTTIINGNCVTLSTTGIGATSYSWSPATGLSNANIASPVANPATTTTYTVTATGSSAGCRSVYSVTVKILDNNGTTSISYPSKINNALTTIQNVTLSGITNGTFTANSANLKINAANGAITPNTSTIGTYIVTYTYGLCSNTITTSVEITADASNHGEVVYPNFYLGATSGTTTPKQVLTQGSCSAFIDYTTAFYTGGTSGTNTSKTILLQSACTALIDYTQSIYVGGTSGSSTSKSILSQGACTAYVNPSNTIYMGGTSGSATPKTFLMNSVCSVPVGNNFYLGGAGTGYGNGNLTPSTSAINGTVVATRSDTTICPGVSIPLSTTGATNYTWTPATALNNTLLASPTASPMTTTTYTVVGSGAGVGCINTAKVTVAVLNDNTTTVSYGAYSFDEADMSLKKVNYIYGPLTGTFSATPAGLNIDPNTGAFSPGFSNSGIYAISYNYTKGVCNYSFVSNIKITTLPPSITYPAPSVFYRNYGGIAIAPINVGGRAIGYELIDSLPAGLTLNTSTGVVSGTATILVDNAQVRVRAFNYTKAGTINYSDTYTMTVSVKQPTINSTTNSVPSLNTTYGSESNSEQFNLSGQYIIENIVITPPNGFELSTNQSAGYGSTLTVTQSGGSITNTTVYIRLKNNAAVGNASGNITLRSAGADSLNIPIQTSYIAPAPLVVTAKYFQKFYGSKIRVGSGNKNFTSTGLMNNETIGSVTMSASGGVEANAPAGTYTITPSAAVDGTFSPANYNITYNSGQFEVLYSLYNFQMTGTTANWVQGKVPYPSISNISVSNITNNGTTVKANISSAYNNILTRGVCWSTSINPTISDNAIDDTATTSGIISMSVTGLTAATTYYTRVYVIIGNKVHYSPNYKFTTSP